VTAPRVGAAHPTADRRVKILALSGSLRARSSDSAMLRAAAALAPAGVDIHVYAGLGSIPLFNPDREAELYEDVSTSPRFRADLAGTDLAAVKDLNDRVREADGLLIACPEYARGVPGAFKNALDWLVGGDAFVAKPFALLNASPRSTHAQASLRLTLETMSGRAVEDAFLTLPLAGRGLDASAIAAEEEFAGPIRAALAAFAAAIERRRAENEGVLVPTP
jgi:NAD(P)H-dependent FMN reductase